MHTKKDLIYRLGVISGEGYGNVERNSFLELGRG
jgi:hypothetical protein